MGSKKEAQKRKWGKPAKISFKHPRISSIDKLSSVRFAI